MLDHPSQGLPGLCDAQYAWLVGGTILLLAMSDENDVNTLPGMDRLIVLKESAR